MKFGAFTAIRRLGEDELGKILLGQHSGRGDRRREMERVVIRSLAPHQLRDRQIRARFLEQARQAKKLAHKNIVEILDVNQDGGDRCYVIERHAEGITLARVVDSHAAAEKRLGDAQVAHVIAKVLRALAYAHEFREYGVMQSGMRYEISPRRISISTRGEIRLAGLGVSAAPIPRGHRRGFVAPSVDLRAVGELLAQLLLAPDHAAPRAEPALLDLRDALLVGHLPSARAALQQLDQWSGLRNVEAELADLARELSVEEGVALARMTEPATEPARAPVDPPPRDTGPALDTHTSTPADVEPEPEPEAEPEPEPEPEPELEPIQEATSEETEGEPELGEPPRRGKTVWIPLTLGMLIPVLSFACFVGFLFLPAGADMRARVYTVLGGPAEASVDDRGAAPDSPGPIAVASTPEPLEPVTVKSPVPSDPPEPDSEEPGLLETPRPGMEDRTPRVHKSDAGPPEIDDLAETDTADAVEEPASSVDVSEEPASEPSPEPSAEHPDGDEVAAVSEEPKSEAVTLPAPTPDPPRTTTISVSTKTYAKPTVIVSYEGETVCEIDLKDTQPKTCKVPSKQGYFVQIKNKKNKKRVWVSERPCEIEIRRKNLKFEIGAC